jgi:hypothetical protein
MGLHYYFPRGKEGFALPYGKADRNRKPLVSSSMSLFIELFIFSYITQFNDGLKLY